MAKALSNLVAAGQLIISSALIDGSLTNEHRIAPVQGVVHGGAIPDVEN